MRWRLTSCTWVVILATFLPAAAQTPAFEVASVKPDKSDIGRGTPMMDGQRIVWRGATLKRMICEAYQVQYAQVFGAPAWADTERYEVEGRSEAPATRGQLRQMLQTLLADRFGLALKREIKALPVYALTVGKGGLKVKPIPEGLQAEPDSRPAINQFHRRASMPQLASLLSQTMSGPIFNGYTGRLEPRDEPPAMVLDQTGLSGLYDINLDFGNGGDGDIASAASAALAAAGLRLDVKRVPIETLTISHAERVPTGN